MSGSSTAAINTSSTQLQLQNLQDINNQQNLQDALLQQIEQALEALLNNSSLSDLQADASNIDPSQLDGSQIDPSQMDQAQESQVDMIDQTQLDNNNQLETKTS